MAGVRAEDFRAEAAPEARPAKHMLVDGNNVLIRAAKAVQYSGMEADGVATGALHVFASMLSRHVRAERPTHLVVCWDGGRSAFRTAAHPGYKAARRDRGTEDEQAPFGLAKRFLTLAGVQHVERDGWEADDLIAAYWRIIPYSGEIVILSSDKDLLQLVGSDTRQVRVSARPPDDVWDSDRVRAHYGCDPQRLPLVMALTGDPGDGVPGVRGIGPKRAVKRLSEANWVWDGLLATLTEEEAAAARLARRLVDLRDAPYARMGLQVARPPEFSETDPTGPAWRDLVDFCDQYRLRQIRERLIAGTLWREGDDDDG